MAPIRDLFDKDAGRQFLAHRLPASIAYIRSCLEQAGLRLRPEHRNGDARRSRRRRGHSTSTTRSRADDVRQTARHLSTFSTCSRIRQASQPLASSGLRRCRYREPRTAPTSSPWMHREHLQLTLPAVVQSTPASPTGGQRLTGAPASSAAGHSPWWLLANDQRAAACAVYRCSRLMIF